MKTRSCFIFLVVITVLLRSTVLFAQNNFTKSKVKAKVAIYNVMDYGQHIVIKNEGNILYNRKPNYKSNELSMSGLDLAVGQLEISKMIKNAFKSKNISVLNTIPNLALTLIVLPTGQIKEISFYLPKNINLNSEDIEVIEKIVKKIQIKVLKPELYINIDFIPISMVLRSRDLR